MFVQRVEERRTQFVVQESVHTESDLDHMVESEGKSSERRKVDWIEKSSVHIGAELQGDWFGRRVVDLEVGLSFDHTGLDLEADWVSDRKAVVD